MGKSNTNKGTIPNLLSFLQKISFTLNIIVILYFEKTIYAQNAL